VTLYSPWHKHRPKADTKPTATHPARNELPPFIWEALKAAKIPSPEEETALLSSGKSKEDCWNTLTTQHLPLLIHTAFQFYSTAKTFDATLEAGDILSYAVLGFLKAIEHYDPKRGEAKLITFALWHIHQHIYRELNTHRFIRIPINVEYALITYLKRQPLPKNSPPPETLEKIKTLLHHPRSLQETVSTSYQLERDIKLEDTIVDESQISIEEQIQKQFQLEAISQTLEELTPQERNIIQRRFGLNTPPETLEEIGRSQNLTRERIRQIEFLALRKIRNKVETKWEAYKQEAKELAEILAQHTEKPETPQRKKQRSSHKRRQG
jgi:RNA polymerase sigma factor (sigma-70 family)